jgi:hypothetical protein
MYGFWYALIAYQNGIDADLSAVRVCGEDVTLNMLLSRLAILISVGLAGAFALKITVML